jgi:hypothetical protein
MFVFLSKMDDVLNTLMFTVIPQKLKYIHTHFLKVGMIKNSFI